MALEKSFITAASTGRVPNQTEDLSQVHQLGQECRLFQRLEGV